MNVTAYTRRNPVIQHFLPGTVSSPVRYSTLQVSDIALNIAYQTTLKITHFQSDDYAEKSLNYRLKKSFRM